MDKLLMIVFNFAIRDKIDKCLSECGLDSYTLVPTVYGAGRSSGKHFETHVWPGKNNLLLLAITEEKYRMLRENLRQVKEKYKNEGIKFFLLSLDEVI